MRLRISLSKTMTFDVVDFGPRLLFGGDTDYLMYEDFGLVVKVFHNSYSWLGECQGNWTWTKNSFTILQCALMDLNYFLCDDTSSFVTKRAECIPLLILIAKFVSITISAFIICLNFHFQLKLVWPNLKQLMFLEKTFYYNQSYKHITLTTRKMFNVLILSTLRLILD